MKLLSTIVASGMFIAGLVALSNAGGPPSDRDALLENLNAANVTYIVNAAEDRGATINVLSNDNVCEVLAQHPDVPVEVYNSVTGETVSCK